MEMGRSGHGWRAMLVALASACAPAEDLGPLPIDVCGQDTPKQILALDDDEFVDPIGGVAQFEDRWLFGVRRFEIPLTNIASTASRPEDRAFAQLDARLESVGACGEDRRTVANDVDYVIPPTTDDAPWLGCRRDTGDVYWIDPDGARPERPIGRAVFCQQVIVRGHDLFFPTADPGDYVRAQLGDDGVVVDVLVTDVVQTSGTWRDVDGESVPTDDIFLLRGEARTLVRLDFTTLEVVDVLDRVDEFQVSGDRRWVMSVRRVPDNPNDSGLPSAQLTDLVEHSGILFWQSDWADVAADLGSSHATVQRFEAGGIPGQTLAMTIPSLHMTSLDAGIKVWDSDGVDVLVTTNPANVVELLEVSTKERRIVEAATFVDVEQGALYYEDAGPYADLDVPEEYRPVDIVRLPLADGAPEVVYERTFSKVELPGDRWLTRSQVDSNQLADLMLVDGDSLEIRRVDRGIVPSLRPYDLDLDLGHRQPWLTDDVVYQVHERASDRGGMWRVRFRD